MKPLLAFLLSLPAFAQFFPFPGPGRGPSCISPSGTTFADSLGDSSKLCWLGGSSLCDAGYVVRSGSPSIAASPGTPATNTACAQSLRLNGAASIDVMGYIPSIPTAIAFDLTLWVYVASNSNTGYNDGWLRFYGPSNATRAGIGFHNLAFYGVGSNYSAETSAMSTETWNEVELHVEDGAAASYIKLNGGAAKTFTAAAVIPYALRFAGLANLDYYIGAWTLDGPAPVGGSPTMLVDFSGGMDGGAPLAADVNTGTHGGNSAFTLNNSPPTVLVYDDGITATPFSAPKIVRGVSYAGNTGMTIKYAISSTATDAFNYIIYTSNPGPVSAYLSFQTDNKAAGSTCTFGELEGGTEWASLSLSNVAGSNYIDIESGPITMHTATIGPLQLDHPYGASWVFRPGGAHSLTIYDLADYSTVGTVTATPQTVGDSTRVFAFGHTGACFDGGNIWMWNIVLDYINGAAITP